MPPRGRALRSWHPSLGCSRRCGMVVGGVIGSGVFLKPSQVAVATQGYVGLILSLWIVLGLVNLCGAIGTG